MTRSRAGFAIVVVALVSLLPSGGAAAAPVTPTVKLGLSSATAWVATSGSFDLHLRVTGVGDPTSVDVALMVHPKVTSRSQFAQTVDGRLLGRPVKQVTFVLADLPVDAHGDRVVSLPLPRLDAPAAADTLPALRMGVYPVTVALRTHGGGELDHFVTQLVRLPDDPTLGPLSVAWIQPIGTRPAIKEARPLRDSERTGLATAVDAVVDNPELSMTLAITPESLPSLDATHIAALRGALGANRQLLATPFVDVDVSALVAAGRGEDLATLRQAGDDALQAALGSRGDPRTWSSERAVSVPALARLRDLGVARIAVPESTLEPLKASVTRGLTPARPFDLAVGTDQTIGGVAVDDGLTAHFRSSRSQVLAAHDLLADLAVLFLDAPGAARGVAVRPPASWHPDATFLGTVLPAIGASPILRPVTLDGLFDGVDPLTSNGSPTVRVTAVAARPVTLPAARLGEARAALDDVAALAGSTSAPARELGRKLLVAESSQLSASERLQVLTAITRSFDDVRNHIRLLDGRTFRLTARSGTIPLTIVNDNPFPVRVDLELSSEKLEFTDVTGPVRSREVLRDLVLPPGTLTRTVPVRARASATFSLRETLLVPGGAEIARGRFTIISTVFSGVGIVLSGGALFFLLLWWGRHWRTVRRGRRLVEPPRQ